MNRSSRTAAAAAVAVLMLSACSGSEEATDSATASEPVTASEATTEVTTAPESTTEAPAGATGTSSEGADASGDVDVVAALEGAGLTSLAAAIETTGLADDLNNLPEFTVFAPDDEAFAALGQDLSTFDPNQLTDILTYHVVDQRILSSDLEPGENTVTTLGGSDLTVTVDGDTVTVGDGATVTQPDVEVGDSGVVHVIDQVLQPAG